LKDRQEENDRLKDEINRINGKDKDGKPKGPPKRSEEDEKLIKDKDDQIAALKKERDQVQKASQQVRKELQSSK